MNPLGESLDFYHRMHGRLLNVEGVSQIGVQLVTLLEQLHSVGFVHADLNPDNIAVCNRGQESDRELFLLNFGHASSFRSNQGVH